MKLGTKFGLVILLLIITTLGSACTLTIDPELVVEEQEEVVSTEDESSETMSETIRPSLEPLYEVITETVVYREADVLVDDQVTSMEMHMDIYQPVDAPEGLKPVIILIHGGGFIANDRNHPPIVASSLEYAARGYVAVAIDYRMTYDNPVPGAEYQELLDLVESMDNSWVEEDLGVPETQFEAVIPSAMDDAIKALDWLTSNAETLSLDMSRVALFGASAGSITALNAAYMGDNIGLGDSPVAAVIDNWGGFVFVPDSSALDTGEAPVFIVHGTIDETISFEYSEALVERAEATDVYYEFYPIEGRGHGFSQIDIMTVEVDGKTIYQLNLEFLDKVLFSEE